MTDSSRLILSAALVLALLTPGVPTRGQHPPVSNGVVGTPQVGTTIPYTSYGNQGGSFVPSVPTMYANPPGGYYPAPNGAYGAFPQAYIVANSNLSTGYPEQKPAGESAGDDSAVETVPAPEAGDFDFDFQLQSAAFGTTTYAAAPAMIGDMFGGGSSTVIINNVMPFSVIARGAYVAGLPGSTMATINFDVSVPNGSTDFISLGNSLTPDGRRFSISAPVPPSDAPTPPAGAGFAFSSGTATNSAIVNPTIGDNQFWDVDYTFTETTSILIPNPGGGVVGRMKIAENASPMPRDRVFFNYSLFDNVPLHPRGVTVNRFTPGFEKTAPHTHNASVEARFPFASTLSSSILSDGATETGAIEFGNIFVSFKRVLEQTDHWLVSAGLSVSIPTASDLAVSMADGTPLAEIQNRSVRLMPFVAGLATLGEGDRVFAHGFLQFDFDTSGNPVALNLTGSGLSSVGTVQSTNFMYVDMGMGYWVRRPGDHPDAFITSIAPTFEVHMNRSLQPADVISSGPFRIGTPKDAIQLDAFVFGGTVGTAGGSSLTAGYSLPFGNHADQSFDGELRAFWNRSF